MKKNITLIIIFFISISVFIVMMLILGSGSCSDGFMSSSIGRRGACSHHGGVSVLSKMSFPLSLTVSGLIASWLFSMLSKENTETKESSRDLKSNSENLNQGSNITTLNIMPQKNIQKNRSLSNKCPRCKSKLVLRTAKRGRNSGNKFWGCSRYPRCRGTRPYVGNEMSKANDKQ